MTVGGSMLARVAPRTLGVRGATYRVCHGW